MKKANVFLFDVYGTLFDVYSVKEKCEEFFPSKGEQISLTWRKKQIEYSFLREMMGQYTSFSEVTKDSLLYAVEESRETINAEQMNQLLIAYRNLEPFQETKDVLSQLQGKTVAVFSNGSRDMLEPLIHESELHEWLPIIISVDDVKHYKPVKEAYQHAVDVLKVKKDEVLFLSSNGWDIAGAKNFGFQTAWINRQNMPTEKLPVTPNYEYNDLNGLLEWR
ncbi:haloacid dehalogenase type II [Peribacillus tepidiphilus]|uniref:haloacid dehalogenase type II n=1 Tax=Peribacillus tepidiphilus TaxID=2652445 RepID=UPI001291DB2D|nr:haloacid dehalogenase type II [Peribacillus tepidiphilus]